MCYRLAVAQLLIFLINKLLQRYFLMIRLISKERIFERTGDFQQAIPCLKSTIKTPVKSKGSKWIKPETVIL